MPFDWHKHYEEEQRRDQEDHPETIKERLAEALGRVDELERRQHDGESELVHQLRERIRDLEDEVFTLKRQLEANGFAPDTEQPEEQPGPTTREKEMLKQVQSKRGLLIGKKDKIVNNPHGHDDRPGLVGS